MELDASELSSLEVMEAEACSLGASPVLLKPGAFAHNVVSNENFSKQILQTLRSVTSPAFHRVRDSEILVIFVLAPKE